VRSGTNREKSACRSHESVSFLSTDRLSVVVEQHSAQDGQDAPEVREPGGRRGADKPETRQEADDRTGKDTVAGHGTLPVI
jgi:hypothetical protein